MPAARAGAPLLAWLLAALTCLLAGLAVVESRREAIALPNAAGIRLPVDGAATGEETGAPTAAPEWPPAPTPAIRFVEDPLSGADDPGLLGVARLTLPPGVALPPEVAARPMVLLVESGTLTVRFPSETWLELGLEAAETDTVLAAGEYLVIGPGKRHAVRNDGPTPAVALVLAIASGDMRMPLLGPGEQLAPSRALLSEDAVVRLERLILPPGTSLPPEVTFGPTLVLVETGLLVVLTDGAAYIGQGPDAVPTRTEILPGQRLTVGAGTGQTIRNDGSTTAVALVVTFLPNPTVGPTSTPADRERRSP